MSKYYRAGAINNAETKDRNGKREKVMMIEIVLLDGTKWQSMHATPKEAEEAKNYVNELIRRGERYIF